MKIKLFLFNNLLVLFCCNANAQQNKTEHRIESKVLFAVIDDHILDEPIELKIVKNFEFNTFKVFNSYKNEYILADSVKVMYVTPFDVSRKSFSGGEIDSLKSLRKKIKDVMNGDIINVYAQIRIANIRYNIYFAYLIRTKDKKLFFMASEFSTLDTIE